MSRSVVSPQGWDLGSNEGNGDGQFEKQIRRRDRKTISCTTCRKRKIRCDRVKPVCGACKKNNVPAHLCLYDDSPWVSTVVKEETLRNQIEELREANERLNQLIRKRKSDNSALQAGYEEFMGKFSTNNGSTPISKSTNTNILLDNQFRTATDSLPTNDKYEKLKKVRLDVESLSICKFNEKKDGSRTFGALSWQSIGLREGSFSRYIIDYYEQFYRSFREQFKNTIKVKESLSAELLNWRQICHTLNIQKRYTSIVTGSGDPNRNDAFGKKLQELAKSMPSYKIVERKFLYFFEMNYNTYLEQFFSEKECMEDFMRIIKRNKKGGITIDVYTESRDYFSELVRLSGILLLIKFGITFSEDDDHHLDPENLILKYTISCLYIGRAYVQPSVTALKVITFLEVVKFMNPNDVGDELYVVNGTISSPILLDSAFHIATSLGIAKKFDKIPKVVKHPKEFNDSHLDEESLQGLWLNLLNLDFRQSLITGAPLILPTFTAYDKTSSSKYLNHIGMMRKMCEKYSIFRERMDQSLDDKFSVKKRFQFTRAECEADLIEITVYFRDNVKSQPKFWEDFKIRTMETTPEVDQRIFRTLDVLDLTTSLSFFLFESYEKDILLLNSQNTSEQDLIDLKNLAHQYLNNTILHASYINKISYWCMEQVITNEAVSKNRMLQVSANAIIKRTLMKAIMVSITIIFRKSTMDEYGRVYNYDKSNIDYKVPQISNVFDHSLHQFDNLCFMDNINNIQHMDFYTENFLNDLMQHWSRIYRCIKQNELMKKDIKWFVIFRELFFGVYYLVQNKRKHCANGKKGDPTKNCSLFEVFNLEEHLKFKKMYEDNIDPEHDYNRYTLKYILN